jgi:predicted metal-dependent phosphoesterase TrpH
MIDLHMHSTCSDGLLTPAELMRRCQDARLRLVSLTDHDSFAGVGDATSAAAQHGIKVIPGCEISVDFLGQSLHLLAYQFDLHNSALVDALAAAGKRRVERTLQLIERLSQLEFITSEDCLASIHRGENIGLRHVVRSIIGYDQNKKRLTRIGVKTANEFIHAMLKQGRPAHQIRENDPAIDEAISLVHQAGGLAVIAHPGLARPGQFQYLDYLIRTLKGFGLDGIESYHGKHQPETIAACHELAKALSLFETAGSDFHEPGQEDGELGTWKTCNCQPLFPDWIR